jgi:hypothetical protein
MGFCPLAIDATVPLLLSKPECLAGMRRKNGPNLRDSVLRCGISPSEDRKRG